MSYDNLVYVSEPLFNNYDMYDVGGEVSPGSGFYSHMQDFKSVSDFLKKRRKKRKKRSKKSSLKLGLLKLAFDFPMDGEIDPIVSDSNYGSYSLMGGFGDSYMATDFEGKRQPDMDVGRQEGFDDDAINNMDDDQFLSLITKLLGDNDSISGISGGLSHDEVDSTQTISENYNGMLSDDNDGTKVVF